MRRADRLFLVLQHLRGGRLVTARKLAEKLEVSERTIYRDIADLKVNGVPIDGEAGVGYILRAGYDLPPLMFTRDEIVALVAGIKLASAWTGPDIAAAANEALVKIEAVLPEADRPLVQKGVIHSFAIGLSAEQRSRIDLIERAASGRERLDLVYQTEDGATSTRTVRPLGLWFWGKVWTFGAWCELREDFRNFRIDRVLGLTAAGTRFADERGKTLADFYRAMARGD